MCSRLSASHQCSPSWPPAPASRYRRGKLYHTGIVDTCIGQAMMEPAELTPSDARIYVPNLPNPAYSPSGRVSALTTRSDLSSFSRWAAISRW